MALGDTAGGGCLVAPLYVQACSGLWAAGFQGCGEEGMFLDQRTELLSLARWVFMELSISYCFSSGVKSLKSLSRAGGTGRGPLFQRTLLIYEQDTEQRGWSQSSQLAFLFSMQVYL